MATFRTAAALNPNPNKSFEVTQPSSDSVSSLSFSPKANYLVASSWDNQLMTAPMHDAPIKEIACIPGMNLLVRGSWDKTLNIFCGFPSIPMYWDIRQSNPVHTQQLSDLFYGLIVKHPLMVVGTADRNMIVNLQNPKVMFRMQ
ncbi:hypothetical protein CJ030_MR3G026657 [Morella rubra]|uniref:Protein RAE1 n=1 Tax=Morella rubra TaxID=262757 RepID=A0A6A1W3T9_9ROSI|nr:hypothetical protein CJ030_MR3G026657 [Morella rubra]